MTNHIIRDEDRDCMAVCCVCGGMGMTRVEDLGHECVLYGHEDIMHDYREVTVCCGSEDYIPADRAVKCLKCGEWVDRRYAYGNGPFFHEECSAHADEILEYSTRYVK